MRGVRWRETLCTVCRARVGVNLRRQGLFPDDYRIARHRARKNQPQICSGSGIQVPEAVVMWVEDGKVA